MNRRKILQLTGTAFVTEIGVKGITGRQEDDTDDGEQNEETEKSNCEADIQFGERELIIDETGFSPRAFAKIGVENVGEAPSGRISATAAWMDEDGNFFDEDRTELSSLGVDEKWIASVEAFAIDPDEIDGFEISGEFDVKYPRTPTGMTITESNFDRGEKVITGVAENTREEDIEHIEAHGKLYDEDGAVLGGGYDLERDFPAGRNWGFEIATPRLPASVEPTDHDVVLDARTFQIPG